MSKRITWIDVARGMAMIAIVFGHTVNMGPWKVWVYSFHVPLFFILSGMTFHVEAAFGRFCIDKARRLLVPYFCFGFASILAFFVAGNFAASILGRGARAQSLWKGVRRRCHVRYRANRCNAKREERNCRLRSDCVSVVPLISYRGCFSVQRIDAYSINH